MLEKLKQNPRLVVAVLITAGVLALVINGGGSNKSSETADAPAETTQSESSEATSSESPEQAAPAPATVDQPIGATPSAGPVVVANENDIYRVTVRKGDNQTVIVRQMVNEYLAINQKKLSAEQRLYIETNVVNKLPRNDKVFENDTIEVPSSVIGEVTAASEQLTDAQKALWAQYL